jgi:hypothetical protein
MAEDTQQLRNHVTQLQAEMATRTDLANLQANLKEALQQAQVEMKQMVQSLLSSQAGSNGSHGPGGGHLEQGRNVERGESSNPKGFNSSDGLEPKTICWEFPRFDGEDPESWYCRAEQYFDYYNTPDPQRLSISSFHMEGRAMVWFQEFKATNREVSWGEFVTALQIRFGRGAYDDPMESLSKLKQEGPLDDYKSKFDTLALKVQGLPEAHKLSCFMGGLKEEIRLLVRMFNPKNLVDAYALARIQEECVMNVAKSFRSSWRSV